MKITEIILEDQNSKIKEIAQRMIDRYSGLSYTPYERAGDHAMGYDSSDPRYKYWTSVQDEIYRLQNKKTMSESRIKYEDLILDYKIDGASVDIRAIIDNKQVGYVVFLRDGKLLIPDDLAVDEEYRGQGIAKKMYDWVKSLPEGFRIIRSGIQTTMGKRFWDKNRGEGGNVWEEGGCGE